MIYCPYTNRELDLTQANREHIIPLALGGMDGIEIPVCRVFNSEVGSKIDGGLANDFLVLTKRNKHDVKGHSGKSPVFVAKKATDPDTGRPLHVHLNQREGLKVWDPIERKNVGPQKLSIPITMDTDVDLRFVAKVALSAGYFVYGDLFRTNVKHDEIRTIMNHRPSELGEDNLYSIETRVDSRLSGDKNKKLQAFRAMCKAAEPHSLIGLVPSKGSLAVFVGILGDYMGMINAPADTSVFPNEGKFWWGHVIVLNRKEGAVRMSFREALQGGK